MVEDQLRYGRGVLGDAVGTVVAGSVVDYRRQRALLNSMVACQWCFAYALVYGADGRDAGARVSVCVEFGTAL